MAATNTPFTTLLNALTPITTDKDNQHHIVALAPTTETPGFTPVACWTNTYPTHAHASRTAP